MEEEVREMRKICEMERQQGNRSNDSSRERDHPAAEKAKMSEQVP